MERGDGLFWNGRWTAKQRSLPQALVVFLATYSLGSLREPARESGDEAIQEGQSALENFRTQWYLTQDSSLSQNRLPVIWERHDAL